MRGAGRGRSAPRGRRGRGPPAGRPGPSGPHPSTAAARARRSSSGGSRPAPPGASPARCPGRSAPHRPSGCPARGSVKCPAPGRPSGAPGRSAARAGRGPCPTPAGRGRRTGAACAPRRPNPWPRAREHSTACVPARRAVRADGPLPSGADRCAAGGGRSPRNAPCTPSTTAGAGRPAQPRHEENTECSLCFWLFSGPTRLCAATLSSRRRRHGFAGDQV